MTEPIPLHGAPISHEEAARTIASLRQAMSENVMALVDNNQAMRDNCKAGQPIVVLVPDLGACVVTFEGESAGILDAKGKLVGGFSVAWTNMIIRPEYANEGPSDTDG